ncbi:MAG: helix-turn-helix transcriptional regulator [Bacteroidetes bacterium]|nr:helix-turn-helix transcriptional regulator [Bacteroidota bacterium]
MTAVKESSTNRENKLLIKEVCPVTFTLQKIGGRWKPLILYNLRGVTLRYGQLRKAIPNITEKMLIQQLRELEADGLVTREIKPVVPPHVEYSLTPLGDSLSPLLNEMAEWGLKNNPQ